MALETKLLQKLNQSLLMTPQLQQAIKLLQLGRQEYEEAIQKELLENPVLEEIQDFDESSSAQQGDATSSTTIIETDESLFAPEARSDWEDFQESFTDFQGSARAKGGFDGEDRPSLEATLTKGESLEEYLISQIRMLEAVDSQKRILAYMAGNLDKDGYLCVSYDELASLAQCTIEEVEEASQLIVELDPPGICARDLAEGLLLQLERLGKEQDLEARIIKNHLDKVEKRKLDQIAKIEKVTEEEIRSALKFIQTLEPRPGRPFLTEAPGYITPDVYVYKIGKEYVIALNDEGVPRLRINQDYLKVTQESDRQGSPQKAYLQEKVKAASWLIRSIHQRQQTILKVTESIMKFQREFLDLGIQKLKPLILKEVADDIGMHESTVSRVTTNKYVHTPQGVFELKFFFTTGIKGSQGEVSSSAVKNRIKELIGQESPQKPVSDQELVELLKKEGISIARRTIAKYREALGILSSAERKKVF